MKTVVTSRVVDDEQLAELLEPRAIQGTEVEGPPGRFTIDDGPFESYERVVEVHPGAAAGSHAVTETTTFQLALPVWGFLFRPLVIRAIKKPPPPGAQLWWMPPDRLDRRATTVLGIVCVYSLFAGYLGVLLSQTNTFFKSDFGASNEDVSTVLIAVRIGAFFALFIAALADRRGRIAVLRWTTIAAMVLAATGAVAPDLVWLGASQTLARSCSAAIALVIAIVAIEEMPSGARAFAVSMMAMAAGLGAGGVVCFLWVADLAPGAWRIFYLVPLLAVIPAIRLGRKLPETRRFEVFEQRDHDAPFDRLARNARIGRFAMLGATAFFFNIFLAPSAAYFNEYFRTERGFSGGQITILQVMTSLPGGLAIIVGGRLADVHGRRLIGSIGVIGGTVFMVATYTTSGWSIWLFAALATLTGALTIPALGVYQSELFPTGSRGLANGGLSLLGVLGGVIGLRVAGVLADPDHIGTFGPVMAMLAIGPAIVAVIVVVFYPETAHTELEVLNPGDAPLPVDPDELEALDATWAAEHDHGLHHDARPGGADPPDPDRGGRGEPDGRDAAGRGPTGTIPPRV